MDFSPPRGVADLLPPESDRMALLARTAHEVGRRFGYRYVETPAFEATEVFARTAGDSSDVVTKEMYTFEDKRGRSLTLRPEFTAQIVRAFLERRHDLPVPFKAMTLGALWRYGRPQTGRMREFRQFDIEVIGTAVPAADVETIAVGDRFLREAGLSNYRLEINSIGDETCRPAYREELLAFLEANRERLTDEHRDHFRDNPLRVLDCKDVACRAVAAEAPKISERLCDACRAHFDAVREGLDEEGLAHDIVPTLVRGLDYYTRTAYEWTSEALPPAQASVGGGGRYDGLAELLGGPPTPGVGFAVGLERVLIAMQAEGRMPRVDGGPACFVVGLGELGAAAAREMVRSLRASGIPAESSLEERSLKAQLRMADRVGADFVAILGERELADKTVTVRRSSDRLEKTIPVADLAGWLTRLDDTAG